MKSRLRAKDTLEAARTAITNSVRGYLRAAGILIRSSTLAFPKRLRERLGDDIPDFISQQLLCLDTINQQISAADKILSQLAKK